MDGGRAGEVWYSARLDQDQLRADYHAAEEELRRSGKVGGDAFGDGLEKGAKEGADAVRSESKKAGDATEKNLGGAATRVKESFSSLKGALAAAGIAAGVATVTTFLSGAINAAGELQDVVSATGVIFGQQAIPGLEAWAEKAHAAFGASKKDALEAANQMAVFGKSAGLIGDELTGFSTGLVQLGGDLASMFGGSTKEAIDAVGAALRGESEPIRRYGVLLDDATLRQRAFEMGLISTTKDALTPQQRVLAAHAEILAQTTDAQGDFARTSDGLMNSQRQLGALWDNFTAKVGDRLLPAVTAFVSFLVDAGIPALEWFADTLAGPLFAGIGNVANAFREAAGDVHFFAMNFGEQGDRVHAIADRFGLEFDDLKDRIRDRMLETGETFEEAVTHIEDEARATAAELPATMDEGLRATHQVVRDVGAEIKAEWDGVADHIPQALADEWDDVHDAAFDLMDAHAQGIIDNQTAPQDAFSEAMRLLDEEMGRAEEIAQLRGQLLTLSHARGVASEEGKQATVEAIDAATAEISQRLTQLGADAFSWGSAIPTNLAAGIWAAQPKVLDSVSGAVPALARGIRGFMPGSEPANPASPLRGITNAYGFVDELATALFAQRTRVRAPVSAIAAEMRAGLSIEPLPMLRLADAAAASRAMAASTVGQLSGAGAFGMLAPRPDSPPNNAPTVVERHIHLHAEAGYNVLENEADTLRTLRSAQWFDELSVTGDR